MKNMKSKTAQLIALSLAVLITMIGMTVPRGVMAQKVESQANRTPGEMEGFEAATSRETADDTRLKEKQAQAQPEIASPDASQMSAPANDNFANAQLLSGTSGTVTGTNVEATLEAGEPGHESNYKTVWYKWTAPSNLSMTFETMGGTFDTAINVYTGAAVNALTQIASNDDINDDPSNILSRVTFIANAGTTYYIQMHGYFDSSGTFNLMRQINHAESSKQFNFDGASGSLTTDYAVYRPSNNNWYIRLSLNGSVLAQTWGTSSDKLYPGDFDNDGSTDIGVWRPSTGTFYALRSSNGTLLAAQWGQLGDQPVQGDFDGDDKADFAVWRSSNGTFYVRKSSDGQLLSQKFGQDGDYLACGDYDGDGKTDFGIQRTTAPADPAVFYYLRSSDGVVVGQQFGLGADHIVPGDYDGDGKNDIAVYRDGINGNAFYALRSTDNSLFAVQWGVPGDVIAPGDYVGNFKSDVTVFRPSTGAFYTLNADTNSLTSQQWGTNGDVPVANSNVH